MLSPNQIELLASVAGAPGPVSLATIAQWHIGQPHQFGDDAARNAMKRMEARGLVVGSGTGRQRAYEVTDAGHTELRAAGGAPSQDSGPISATRNYIVLEAVALEDLDAYIEAMAPGLDVETVHVHVATVDARNTSHALRAAATAYPGPEGTPELIPVAERYWQPYPVKIGSRRTVSLGA